MISYDNTQRRLDIDNSSIQTSFLRIFRDLLQDRLNCFAHATQHFETAFHPEIKGSNRLPPFDGR